ncbi:MAG TPA: hypothetical protein VMU08_17455 [Rhizomicrobium sp.]|nr:hypothetical protein [Rhizomicrobium sp.]
MAGKLGGPVPSLADGAERLERIIRGVKDRQLSDAHNVPVLKPATNAFAVSPEEAWSKKFMTAGIGPTDFKATQMPTIAVSAPVAGTAFRPAPKSVAAPAPQARTQRPATIGQVLAKPARKRSWFGRLVRGT